jgi:hypothetical protein
VVAVEAQGCTIHTVPAASPVFITVHTSGVWVRLTPSIHRPRPRRRSTSSPRRPRPQPPRCPTSTSATRMPYTGECQVSSFPALRASRRFTAGLRCSRSGNRAAPWLSQTRPSRSPVRERLHLTSQRACAVVRGIIFDLLAISGADSEIRRFVGIRGHRFWRKTGARAGSAHKFVAV